MKLGIVVYSSDAETAWNAFRFGSFALKQGDAVRVFLLGKGVESESLHTEQFSVRIRCRHSSTLGAAILACGRASNCDSREALNFAHSRRSRICTRCVRDSDRVVSF